MVWARRPRRRARWSAVAIGREAAEGEVEVARALATRGVVEIQRKLKREKEMFRIIVERPTPARESVPRRPTNAVSIRERRGSRARAPRAGRARVRIWRFRVGWGGGVGSVCFDVVVAKMAARSGRGRG